MELVRALPGDLDRVRAHYHHLLDARPELAEVLCWKKEIYPADADWLRYIARGELYLLTDGARIAAAMAVAGRQEEGYHGIEWLADLPDEKAAVLHILAVAPEDQGKGIASEMVGYALKLAEKGGKSALRLDALCTNLPAQRLYERLGFSLRGRRRLWYESTGNAEFLFYEKAVWGEG